MFVHTVYFWIKPNTPAAAIEQLVKDCREILVRIPTVRELYAGRPMGATRDVVDASFAVGLTVLFDDAKGHDTYQVHEIHKEFIERNKAHWSRVQVYDYQ
jgi:hypothetical protein